MSPFHSVDGAGKAYWRSLEELAGSPEFSLRLRSEFPHGVRMGENDATRREFLKTMAAALALAGTASCTREPDEKIVPHAVPPELAVPGKPLHYATASALGGYALGLLVESHEGRPTKIEGNPDHPASLGATDALAQAELLTLFDPERSQVVTRAGRISTWVSFLTAVDAMLKSHQDSGGAGLRLLTETVTSPSLADQIRRFQARFPAAKWHVWDPVGRANEAAGTIRALGRNLTPRYRFESADVVVSLDADFMAWGPGRVRYARDFARRRDPASGAPINRLYAIESTPSITGAMADHRRAAPPSLLHSLARKLSRAILEDADPEDDWLAAVARDLKRHRGTSVVLVGETQPPWVHALAHVVNDALGNIGQTVDFCEPVEAGPADPAGSLAELVEDLKAGRVEALFILGGNPIYTAPADLELSKRFERAAFRVHASLYEDETSRLCHWHVPQVHFLETWGDARAYDGTVALQQPLIAPLYGGKSPHEFLSVLLGTPNRNAHDTVKEYWQERLGGEKAWLKALHDGVVAGSALPSVPVSIRRDIDEEWAVPPGGLEIAFRPDPTIWDGSYANNAWLQELPKPLTKLTWENAAMVAPATAARLGLKQEDVVEVIRGERRVRAPLWILPGQAENCVTLHLGYGRSRAGRVGNGLGFNAYALRTMDGLWTRGEATIEKAGGRHRLASTQTHHAMEGRHLVREAAVETYQSDPKVFRRMEHVETPAPSLYPEHPEAENAWGMTIDLSLCTGCNACVTACQAENNIPTAGRSQVLLGREMHWIRIDRYYEGDPSAPRVLHQPVPCMHCEQAPCEPVCPVGATTHSDEGLNEMTYNRCVGTRYCSNNCPYKVRRFNFFQYADSRSPALKLMRNPDVSVRERGVMEKCTYCVQRISEARIHAGKEGRPIRDGEIRTACQQVCPVKAITFGNIADPRTAISRRRAEPRHYALLGELNTRPRTTYLGKVWNSNPEIPEPPRHQDTKKNTLEEKR
ncbi:MAG: TAT-variant-translocated molybdopterin oxidoreductase [Planctomycetes bacterium]|nr:TAT-variant-translocated molybdopterin oxidoreductase [Planctomycetota bacterium]